jgi:hypothetical protein
MWVAIKLRDQHQPRATKPKKSYRMIEAEYRINKNFDGEVTTTSCIYATEEPINFFTTGIVATSEATGAEYLDDINFKVHDESGRNVVYQQIENDLRQKKVVVYFLPRIEPGEESPRKIVTTYKWPGLFNQLKIDGTEKFAWSVVSLSDIQKVKFIFLFEKGSGDELVCEALSTGTVQSTPVNQDGNWAGQTFVLDNVPAGKYEVELVLRLKKA